jgi:hypothetical protein
MDNDGISLELRQERVRRAHAGFLGNGVIAGKEAVEVFRVMTLISGLKLEIKGLGLSRGVSCHNIVKRSFGFKGNKQKVLEQLLHYKFVNYPPPPFADPCPLCGARALVEIPDDAGVDKSDGSEYLCHPVLEGCNWSFQKDTK